jgi:hypothetical protein
MWLIGLADGIHVRGKWGWFRGFENEVEALGVGEFPGILG